MGRVHNFGVFVVLLANHFEFRNCSRHQGFYMNSKNISTLLGILFNRPLESSGTLVTHPSIEDMHISPGHIFFKIALIRVIYLDDARETQTIVRGLTRQSYR